MKKRIELVYIGDIERRGCVYHDFQIRRISDGRIVGECSLKEAKKAFVESCGNVAYRIEPEFRGNRYGAEALRALRRAALRYCISRLVICCTPENLASQKTALLGGAKFDKIVELDPSHEKYAYGTRRVMRYYLDVATS